MTVRLLRGDCREVLKTLADESVHCVVTSPPYWGLRDYGTAVWHGGDPHCEHKRQNARPRHSGGKLGDAGGQGAASAYASPMRTICSICGARREDAQLGLEATPQEYVENMVSVFREVRRVLRSDGTLWLNLGDSYATGAGKVGERPGGGAQGDNWHGAMTSPNRMPIEGLKPKDLVGIPWRVAFALQADGWWLRQDIIWAKPNPMPESVRDRCTKAHEYIFLFSKSERYYYDIEAISEPVSDGTVARYFDQLERIDGQHGSERVPGKTNGPMKAVVKKSGNLGRKPASARGVPIDTDGKSNGAVAGSVPWEGTTRNKRSVWTVTTVPFKEAHFATFPPALIVDCILAGCPPAGKRCDCEQVIETPTGSGPAEDPSLTTGRAGMNRERREDGGTRPITRREQRWHARQMKESVHREEMRGRAGESFDHYIRTDSSGARPLPEALRQEFMAKGWIKEAPPCECREEPAGVVLDPFGGAGTTGLVADRLQRDAILVELNPEYAGIAERRIIGESPLFAEVAA